MVGGLKSFRRFMMPASVAALALMIFSGCVAEVDVQRGHYYSGRIWHSNPYCYGYSYGCRMYGHDGARIRIIRNRRWGRHHMTMTANLATAQKATWQSEFGLNNRAVNTIQTAFNQALEGKTALFYSLGFTNKDARAMSKFRMPAASSVAKAAATIGVNRQDLSDFLEVFTIRMKSAFAANEQFE